VLKTNDLRSAYSRRVRFLSRFTPLIPEPLFFCGRIRFFGLNPSPLSSVEHLLSETLFVSWAYQFGARFLRAIFELNPFTRVGLDKDRTQRRSSSDRKATTLPPPLSTCTVACGDGHPGSLRKLSLSLASGGYFATLCLGFFLCHRFSFRVQQPSSAPCSSTVLTDY